MQDSQNNRSEPMDTTHHKSGHKKLAFVASTVDTAMAAKAELEQLYGSVSIEEADIVVALGGDGLMLQTLHETMKAGSSIYGMHQGSLGFLMNDYRAQGLHERLASAETNIIHPLQMRVFRLRRQ